LQKKDKKWAEESGERRQRRRAKVREEKSKENRAKKKKEISVFSIQEQYVQRL